MRTGGWGTALLLYGKGNSGSVRISIYDTAANLSKAPRSYPLFSDGQSHDDVKTAYAEITITIPIECRLNTKAKATVTLTSVGGVDGVIAGTISGLRWKGQDVEECGKLGEKASFKLQRAVDYRQ
jgi:hypothetical protein